MIYGYARVSTEAQDLTSQLAQLKAAGCEKIFRTGATADWPQRPGAVIGDADGR
jgi:DNA invertase Pin-like site-specific DNA recombinase